MAISEQVSEIFITFPPESQYCDFNYVHIPSQYVTTPREKCKRIRVISSCFGNSFRMSAPEIDIMVDGSTPNEAWTEFLKETRKLNETNWLAFDIGPTRPEEINEGLNVPENEDWSEPLQGIKE